MDNEELNEQIQDEQEMEQPEKGTPEEESGDKPEFVLDENGELQWNTDEFDHLGKEDSEEEQPNYEEAEEENQEPEEQKYKVKVDGQEIEVTQEELLRGYMRQSDYTRKTQQLASDRQRYEQLYEQNYMQQQHQQEYQPEPQQTYTESEKGLNDIAKKMAAQRLGLESEDDLSELDFDHITAVIEAKQALLNQRDIIMNRKRNIDNLEAQLRSEEPKYDEIMANVNDAMQKIPVSRFNQLKQAYNDGNPEPLREFFKEVQKDYYSKAIQKVDNKRNKSVPKVVPSGNTPVERQEQRKRIDFRKFGTMTTDQKAKILLDMGFVD